MHGQRHTMRAMNKWFAATAACVMAAGLAACGNGPNEATSTVTKTVVDNRTRSNGARTTFEGGDDELVVGTDIVTGTYNGGADGCTFIVRDSLDGDVVAAAQTFGGQEFNLQLDKPGTTIETSSSCGTWILKIAS